MGSGFFSSKMFDGKDLEAFVRVINTAKPTESTALDDGEFVWAVHKVESKPEWLVNRVTDKAQYLVEVVVSKLKVDTETDGKAFLLVLANVQESMTFTARGCQWRITHPEPDLWLVEQLA